MIKDIDIPAFQITCDDCDNYLIIPKSQIHLNLGDEIQGVGWSIENGRHYCGECKNG